jgi:hypothetical protein
MKPLPDTLSRTEFAALHCVARITVTRWLEQGHAVLAEGTDRIEVRVSNRLLAQRPEVYRGGVVKTGVAPAGVNALGETAEEAFQLDALKEALRRFGTIGMKKIPPDVLIVAVNKVIDEWNEWERTEWERNQYLG